MPSVRIEWVPVGAYGLGLLGFDHLQLVFEPGNGALQDDWFVMEGVREPTPDGTFLGIEGADGRLTLANANLASRTDLTDKIGTPEHRGSRALPYWGDELQAWEKMASYARDIEAEDYPYIAFSLPGSPTPTVNSTSAIASLIHYSGHDPTQRLPYGLHLSPGMATLLGTGADDRMRTGHGFTTMLGGGGRDAFEGSPLSRQIEKFYGGEGDDFFLWSPGFNIVHGGQPQLAYAADGTDVIDYSGAGEVTISFNRHWIPHKVPNFVAVSGDGIDHLFSVERIQWNAKTDHIVLGKGIDLLEDNRVSQPVSSLDAAPTHVARLVATDAPTGARLIGTRGRRHQSPRAPPTTRSTAAAVTTRWPAAPEATATSISQATASTSSSTAHPAPRSTSYCSPAASRLATSAPIRAGDADLLLTLPGGGSVTVRGFFLAPGAGIDRIVFDHAPPWSRDELAARARRPAAGRARIPPTPIPRRWRSVMLDAGFEPHRSWSFEMFAGGLF